MSKKTIIKTCLEKPPEVLEYWWSPIGESEPQRFPVGKDGTLEGLSVDHPRWLVLEQEWKLVVEEIGTEIGKKEKPQTNEEVL